MLKKLLLAVFTIGVMGGTYHSTLAQASIENTTTGVNGMVSTQDTYASQVGIQVLKQGGNAIDAAYAMGYVMAVTHPQAGNLGGGGFMLIYDAKNQQTVALDYREKAPKKAHKDLFLDEKGNVSTHKSRLSPLSVGVPGTVLGLETAHQRYGKLNREDLLDYAIQLAHKGFILHQGLEDALERYQSHLARHQETKAVFFNKDQVYKAGDLLKQPALAKTLRRIKKKGSSDFYSGKIAKEFVRYLQSKGGIISLYDLAAYKPVWREPVIGRYRALDVASMPPPSSGGIALIQTLGILSHFDIKKMGHNTADTVHIMADTLKYVYADRATELGDSDFVEVPMQRLISKTYTKALASKVSTKNIVKSNELFQSIPSIQESSDTTHFVVIDKEGNCVSNTYTLNFNFGNGMLVPKLGFLLNNEMDDFSAKPGVANAYGLLGNEKNSVQAEKRMLSSMTPTIILKDKKPFIITGSPGGSRIITTVLQVIVNVVDHDMSIEEAVAAPRFHHQGKPDILFVEKGFPAQAIKQLTAKGFVIKESRTMGSAQSIMIDQRGMIGTADPRKKNASALGLP